jgi:hypothetical protein
VDVEASCWRGNEPAGLALLLVQQSLRLENQRVGEWQVLRHLDSVVVLSLVKNERMRVSSVPGCQVLG